MSKVGIFPIPNEFRSEDRWFRYFNRKQAVVLVLVLLTDYKVVMAASHGGMLVPAIIGMLFFSLLAMGVVMVSLPVDALFLGGGGLTLDQLLYRLLYRKYSRALYVKTYSDQRGEGL